MRVSTHELQRDKKVNQEEMAMVPKKGSYIEAQLVRPRQRNVAAVSGQEDRKHQADKRVG